MSRLAPFDSLELLETRNLLTYTPVGPIPDLTVSGIAGPIAAYRGNLTVTVQVSNIETSMGQVDPLAISVDQTSQADAPASTVGVYINRFGDRGLRGAVKIGTIAVPAIAQNSNYTLTQTFTLPGRPARYPGSGGKVFVYFRSDDDGTLRDLNQRNDLFRVAQPVKIFAGLPDLTAISVDLPATIQPGDVIAPGIKVANYGTVNSNLQAPVTVLLVASEDKFFGPGDVVVGQYQISSLAPLSQVPVARTVLGNVNLDDPENVVALTTTVGGETVVSLPSGGPYYLGVIVDPFDQIRELKELIRPDDGRLQFVKLVQSVHGMTPADTVGTPAPTGNVFPIPAYGAINVDFATTSATTAALTSATRLTDVSFQDAYGRKLSTPTKGPRKPVKLIPE
jgi:hypothetical protein